MDKTHISRILIIGPESTGKTALAQSLAQHYGTVWAPEFVRLYLEQKAQISSESHPVVEEGDIMPIIDGQVALEQKYERKAKKLLFCDAGTISSWVYAEHYFNPSPIDLLPIIRNHSYSFCLLSSIDIPWMPDWQRQQPERREELFMRFKTSLQHLKVPFQIVSGLGNKRLQCAIQAIDQQSFI